MQAFLEAPDYLNSLTESTILCFVVLLMPSFLFRAKSSQIIIGVVSTMMVFALWTYVGGVLEELTSSSSLPAGRLTVHLQHIRAVRAVGESLFGGLALVAFVRASLRP